MKPENLNMDELTEARRNAVAASIRTIDIDELKVLGERLFPFLDHPWREVYFNFIAENAGATFYHATSHDKVQFIYCHGTEKGIWFMPDVGRGPMQPKGLAIMKQIVEGR